METCLHYITLNVINKILFNKKLTPKAQILYINCLMAHFNKIDMNKPNFTEFEILITEIKNYSLWEANFKELMKENIIFINPIKITVYDRWSPFLNSNLIYYLKSLTNDINIYYNETLANKALIEISMMRTKLSEVDVKTQMSIFYKEQLALNKKYNDVVEYNKHFFNWLKLNVSNNKIIASVKNNNIKLLGED